MSHTVGLSKDVLRPAEPSQTKVDGEEEAMTSMQVGEKETVLYTTEYAAFSPAVVHKVGSGGVGGWGGGVG